MTNDNKPGPHLKVVEFVPPAVETNEDAIRMLERLLEDARAGRIIEVAVAMVNADRSASSEATCTNNAILLMGAISRLYHRQHLIMDDLTTFQPHAD